jgi:GTP 3',8-cyclase
MERTSLRPIQGARDGRDFASPVYPIHGDWRILEQALHQPNASPMPSRTIDYLRISITDRCNERCLYCMPEGFRGWKEREDILSFEEILRAVKIAASLEFRKFRITGGEPLIRKGVTELIANMRRIPGVESIGLTTNGTLLSGLAPELKEAGLDTVNISLDALSPELYRRITQGELEPVLEGIQKALALGFKRVKINTVLMRGMNENEIWPLLNFVSEHHLPIRFIELMPISIKEMLSEKNFLPVGEVMQMIQKRDRLIPLDSDGRLGHGPAKYYRLEKLGVTAGFIGAITNLHFCDHCNKIRLTADGKLRPCLGNHQEVEIRSLLRAGARDEDLANVFRQCVVVKPPEHLFRQNYEPNRIMTAIGG